MLNTLAVSVSTDTAHTERNLIMDKKLCFNKDDYGYSNAMDMTEIYKKVAEFCKKDKEICPQIGIVNSESIPTGYKALFYDKPLCILASNKLSSSELIDTCKEIISNPRKAKNSLAMEDIYRIYPRKDMTFCYLIMAAIAESLKVKCPVLDIKNNYNPMYLIDEVGETPDCILNLDFKDKFMRVLSIFILEKYLSHDPFENLMQRVKWIAFGMREVWQREYDYDFYWKYYDFFYYKSEYVTRPAMVDKYAYAYLVLKRIFGDKAVCFSDFKSQTMNDAIKARMKDISSDDIPELTFEQLCKC